ncbi:MAG TPA: methyltransferase domain-containing protein [Gemmatimonadaceae bacterium]|nr:methyltransferase domain-containing protein [Gemmatimonadaceae bacterium]
MSRPHTDAAFAGSIPTAYDEYLVPLIFTPYAADLVTRLASRPLSDLLEVAAGTGVVTRALASDLPDDVSIVASDLNPAMLERAAAVGTRRPVKWQPADAMQLPFADASFDAVVCQFGVMFFPDKPQALSEFLRVLRPGGVCIFSVWDRIETNEIAAIVEHNVASLFPAKPPRFLSRTPYGYNDKAVIERDVRAGGFTERVQIDTVTSHSRAPRAHNAVVAFCHGTPLRNEIDAHGADKLDEAVHAATEGVARRFGRGTIDARIQAHVVTVSA